MSRVDRRHILVTGGAGYVGSVLVPHLLQRGHRVRVLDLYLFGRQPLATVRGHPRLEEMTGDIRDRAAVAVAVAGVDVVVHLAAISNDPSCDLDPELTRSVNLDSFAPLVQLSRAAGVQRFIFASSSSVYGISDAAEVREDHPQRPITLYNQYKGECEKLLFEAQSSDFTTVAVRPATLCGRTPRQRLDLTVNILTAHAVARGVITVFGGSQQRPNLHVRDMVELYDRLLDAPAPVIAGQAFNAGAENLRVAEIARRVRAVVEREVPERRSLRIETTTSDDPRSYHICTEKVQRVLGFLPQWGIDDAVRELAQGLRSGGIPDPLQDARYYNVRWMQQLGLR